MIVILILLSPKSGREPASESRSIAIHRFQPPGHDSSAHLPIFCLAESALAWEKWGAHILLMLPDEQATPEQIAIFRKMAPARRLALAERLYWSARALKAAWLRRQYADWTEDQIAQEVRRLFTHART